MIRCRSCRRTVASDADWLAFQAATCDVDNCVWGGDRCWNGGVCGYPPDAVTSLVAAAKALRGRRQWNVVPH